MKRPSTVPPEAAAPLDRVLDQSEQAQGKVEQAAVDLSSVKAGLASRAVPAVKVAQALTESEAIHANVLEASAELVAVNDALAEEIEERRELEAKLEESEIALSESRAEAEVSRHSALHDALTGLPNLTLFHDRLSTALAQAERHAWRLAVMFIDLDAFKKINDTLGHDVGDRVLAAVGRRLEAMVRGGDTVSRRSGDEFLFLMVEAKDASNVDALATRIARTLAEPYDIDGVPITLGASVGVARYPEDGRDGHQLLARADAAMYAAKKAKQKVP